MYSFLTIAFILKLLLGFADGQVNTTVYSMAMTNVNRDYYVALLITSGGFGAMFAPVIGSYFFANYGYPVSLYVFSVMIVMMMILTAILVRDNEYDPEDRNAF